MVRNRLFSAVLIFIFLVCFLAWFRLSEAEDFKLQDISGREVSLEEFISDQPVLLLFWTTWCSYCHKALKGLINAVPQLDTSRVLLINIGEKREKAKNFLTTRFKNNPFKVLIDHQRNLSSEYKVIGIPSFIIIDEKGEVEFRGSYLPSAYREKLR